MYSAEINTDQVVKAQELFETSGHDVDSSTVKRWLNRLGNELTIIQNTFEKENKEALVDYQPLGPLENVMLKFNEAVREWLPKQPDGDLTDQILSVFFACSVYLKIAEYYDESYRIIIKKQKSELTYRNKSWIPVRTLMLHSKRDAGRSFFGYLKSG